MNDKSLNPRWQNIRIFLSAVSLIGVTIVLTKNIFTGETKPLPVTTDNIFPKNIPLANLTPIDSNFLKPKDNNLSIGSLYRYSSKNGIVTVQNRYETRTDGNVSRLLMLYDSVPPATVFTKEKYKEGIGYYGMFEYKDRAFISACIPPRGYTSLTQKQFVHNRYWQNGGIIRAIGWLIGQNDLFDSRCLWTSVNIPIEPFAPPDTLKSSYRTLEDSWFEVVRWWRKNYPPS